MTAVLVTGAAGNVGGLLRPGLDGLHLRAVDTRPVTGWDGADVRVGDLADPGFAAAAVEGMDAVVHLAANPHPGASWPELRGPNADVVVTLLDAAWRAGVSRVLLASSVHAMGGYVAPGGELVEPATELSGRGLEEPGGGLVGGEPAEPATGTPGRGPSGAGPVQAATGTPGRGLPGAGLVQPGGGLVGGEPAEPATGTPGRGPSGAGPVQPAAGLAGRGLAGRGLVGRGLVEPDWPVRPCCTYGASKAFAEAYGRTVADGGGPSVLCLRLGGVLPAPLDSGNLLAWLSPGDLRRLVRSALAAEVRYGCYFGVSANTRGVFSYANAVAELGYRPESDAETHAAALPLGDGGFCRWRDEQSPAG